MTSIKSKYGYARLDLHLSKDQDRWIRQQAKDAGLKRSQWAKRRLLASQAKDYEQGNDPISHHLTTGQSTEEYQPQNPLDCLRETGLLTHQILAALKQIHLIHLPPRDREQLEGAIASARALLKIHTLAARREKAS